MRRGGGVGPCGQQSQANVCESLFCREVKSGTPLIVSGIQTGSSADVEFDGALDAGQKCHFEQGRNLRRGIPSFLVEQHGVPELSCRRVAMC